ncbi:Protein VAC14-like protein [Zalerion maritima]|uniref:Protein VAC14-like protein n=1 Tax=Zalerion maritima TaxID=339359 RepID=A0AAD5RG84_9PEZI|nr:Protein VAC14-like protein [Zalerion maritima]
MSFRGDDARRYGAVPPVQYPVTSQGQDQYPAYPQRRNSFNTGDDSAFFDQNASRPQPGTGGDELFLGNTGGNSQSPSRQQSYNSGAAVSGYQHQYQTHTPPTPSTYNPQAFARTQSTALPYHPQPSVQSAALNRYPTTTAATSAYSHQQHQQHQQPQPQPQQNSTNYTPAPYNPALYSSTSPTVPSRQPTYHGYTGYGGSYASPTSAQSPASFYNTQSSFGSASQQSGAPTPTSQQGFDHGLPSPQYANNNSTPTSTTGPSGYDGYSTYQSNYHRGSSYTSNGSSPAPAYGGATTNAPYPTVSQMPVGPNYQSPDLGGYSGRGSRSNSQTSPLPSPSGGSQIPQRHPTNAPLPSRPMADLPEEVTWSPDGADVDDLMNEIEGQLGRGSSQRQRPAPINGNLSDDDIDQLRRYNSTATTANQTDQFSVNRLNSNASTINRNAAQYPYEGNEYESDPEGAFGAAAMAAAEQEDRRFSGGSGTYNYPGQPAAPAPLGAQRRDEDDSDNVPFDLGLFGGGYAGTMSYGNDVGSPPQTGVSQPEVRLSTPQQQQFEYSRHDNSYKPFTEAGVDYEGTGGLQAPSSQPKTYEEEGEHTSIHSKQSESDSPSKEEYPDMFFHPGISNRPLPAIPPPGSDSSSMLSVQVPSRGHSHSLSADSRPSYQSDGQGGYYSNSNVERSISMSSHSNTPPVHAPARSQTDAALQRSRLRGQVSQSTTPLQEGYDTGTPTSLSYDTITLPRGRRKLNPSKLTTADFNRCWEPWALSCISRWTREMAEGENDLKKRTIEECLVKLFTHKVSTMNIADAELLGRQVVELMFEEGILIPEEEWVKWGPGEISGVLWQLTGSGCYSPRVHENEMPGRCYSYHCTRTVKKADLEGLQLSQSSAQAPDWPTFYKLTKEDIDSKPSKEVQRQFVLHEIVTSEEEYVTQLDVLRILYRDQLRQWQPPLISPGKIDKFVAAVFGRVDGIQQCNRENLLAQLKYRQKEQGPWILGYSDLFREWIRKAKDIYIDYSYAYPYAVFMVKKEQARNVLFNKFLQDMQSNPLSKRLDYSTYLKNPITRLQRYTLLLGTVLHKMKEASEERSNLEIAIGEIKAVTLECDAKVAEMQKKVDMMELDSSLVLRPGFHAVLNLDHLGRELIHQGELQRVGSKGVRWLDAYGLLLDHYFILAKKIEAKDGKTGKKYDVSKEPIPMPLLFLESVKDDPISKQKGLPTPLTRTAAGGASDTRLNKLSSNGDRPILDHAATSSSMSSMSRLNTSDSASDAKILYPFKIKHLGHETYTLFAKDASLRESWCNKIIEAKTRHAKALYAQNAEPFSLRVIADTAFQYDTASAIGKPTTVSVSGTPLDRAIREMEKIYGPGRGPGAVCRAQVNCATGFMAFTKPLIAVGTDYGVYISEATNPRGWTRTCQATKVTQIAILEEFSVCLLIANRELTSYPLDVIAPVSNFPAPLHDNPRRAPHRLAKDVSFFATARMKDRMLIFYKRKESMHNTFNVLEPVFQRSTQQKRSLFSSRRGGAGNTETFRDFDQFYLPTECYSLNLFQSYIAVATAKGFELLTLDKKQPMSIPDLRQPSIANIASRVRDQRPLGMFKLNGQEFLLAYEDCAVYVDKHGDVSRTLIMEYSGKQKKAKAATMYGQYLVLFNEDYVEVRNAENGRLRQIIAGRDVRALDYGVRGPTGMSGAPQDTSPNHYGSHHQPSNWIDPAYSKGTVKIAMSHPEISGTQIVFELVLNEGHSE